MEPTHFDAVIFDLDGVITDTAGVHAHAWKEMFDEFLRERAQRSGEPFQPFDAGQDYLAHVDGKPRLDGIRAFLASRGIELKEGSKDDPPSRATVRSLARRKNRMFRDILARDGVEVFHSTVRLIKALLAAGRKVAVVSSSKNCQVLLQRAGIEALFEARVDGTTLAAEGLKGKPAPDMFVECARRIGVSPARATVVEDAIAGVQAGRGGGFGLVIGVDRHDQRAALSEGGADIVVSDLEEIDVEGMDRWFRDRHGTDKQA